MFVFSFGLFPGWPLNLTQVCSLNPEGLLYKALKHSIVVLIPECRICVEGKTKRFILRLPKCNRNKSMPHTD